MNVSRKEFIVASAAFAMARAGFADELGSADRPFGAGTNVLKPRIKRLLGRALDHDVFPSPVKVKYDPADEKLPEPVRVMPPVMAMGQAAGTAAALCLKTGSTPRTLDSKSLVDVLRAQGAFLG